MSLLKRLIFLSLLITTAWALSGCITQQTNSNVTSTIGSPSPTPLASPQSTTDTAALPITLPVLDAFFSSDQRFAQELSDKVGLTSEQIENLRNAAREETGKLRENDQAGEYAGTTEAARELAADRVKQIVGEDKAQKLFGFVRERWQGAASDETQPGTSAETPATEAALPTVPNSVPTDTRVVVNSPAYRMDVFENGKLIRSYKVGIGYPEFPLPTGMRKAKAIIFNPEWTPPDEPWVESPTSKVKVGEKVEAGSKLNPLGLLKIPIGSPSLIHGGKSPAKIGTFASHGCVGLTDPMVQDFAKVLSRVSGGNLSDADIATYKRNRSQTKQVTLKTPVPVELRYETIVAEDGKLHIYRDVYDRDTNTEENLRAVLEAQGVKLEDLSQEERDQVMEALKEMSRDAKGRDTQSSASPSPVKKSKSGRVTRTVKGKKEIVIEIAALKGKGYPTMT